MIGERGRTIKLLCPRLSNIVQLVASEEQRVDLGCISGAFGLDPSTLKLNGHFISRGVDLIASSVTWKSLLSFFSARGLSTGATDSDALLVDGKLSKVGTKRAHDPTYIENGIPSTSEFRNNCVNRRLRLEDSNLLNKRFRDRNSGFQGSESGPFGTMSKAHLPCSFIGENMKRMREDEMIVTSPCKKMR